MQKHAITTLSIVPVRAEPSFKAELTSQLLFGELCKITEEQQGNWLKIEIDYDGYTGWVESKQLELISLEKYNYFKTCPYFFQTQIVSIIKKGNFDFPILVGSTIYQNSKNEIEVNEHIFQYGQNSNLDTNKDLVTIAKKYMGAPYLWGGKTPFGVDCSGFVQQVFKILGHKLQRDAWQQATQGTHITNISDSKTSDLAFFTSTNEEIAHVGIILEDIENKLQRKIIHASGEVKIDFLDENGIVSKDTTSHSHSLYAIKRIV